ncbi:hypothetical protein FOZ62_004057, partial [Perkinsus olseni]
CDYELCGECYPMRSSLHCPLHEFNCILRPRNKKRNADVSRSVPGDTGADRKNNSAEAETDSSSGSVDTEEFGQTSEEDGEESSIEEIESKSGTGCPFVEAAKKALAHEDHQ